MTSEPLPSRADVLIIGSGIIGSSTAYYLSKHGVSAVVVDKGSLANEQSSRNWGWLRQQGRNVREIPLAMFSLDTWKQLPEELDADFEYIQQGSVKLAYSEEELARCEGWTEAARQAGLDTVMLTVDEVKERFPFLEGPSFLGAAFTPGDAQAEPLKATEAIARAAMENGARFYTHCAVEKIDVTNGAATGVVTERGPVKADIIVCAAGAWSGKLARMVGLHLPQTSVRATVAETTPGRMLTHTTTFGHGLAFRQKRDGTFYIAGGQLSDYDVTLESFRHVWTFLPGFRKTRRNFKLRVGSDLAQDILRAMPWSSARRHPFAHAVDMEPKPNASSAGTSLRNLMSLVPSLGQLSIRRTWAGRVDATADATPVIGEAPGLENFVFATGFSGHGFTMGPGAGRTVAELILNGKTTVDVHPLRFSRFKEKDLADMTFL